MSKILNFEELSFINGGILTQEAEDWWTRNKDAVLAQVPSFLRGQADSVLDSARASETVYDVATIKATLSGYGLNVNDLT